MDWETWGLPLMILSVGLSAGIFLATRTTTADTAARPKDCLLYTSPSPRDDR